jgi:hypothetical protein
MLHMNDDVIQDLKQFIATTVSQQLSSVHTEIKQLDDKLTARIDDLDTKLTARIDDLSASVAEAMDTHGEVTEAQLSDHEQRITKLETKTA